MSGPVCTALGWGSARSGKGLQAAPSQVRIKSFPEPPTSSPRLPVRSAPGSMLPASRRALGGSRVASPPRAVPAEARPGQAAPGGLTSKLFAFYVVFEEQSGVGLTRDRSVHRPHLLGEKLRRSEGRGRGPSPGSPRSSAPCHLPTSPPLLIPGKTLSTPKTHTFYTLTGCGGALLSPAVRQRGFKDLSFGSGAAFPAARPSRPVVAQLVSVPTPTRGLGWGDGPLGRASRPLGAGGPQPPTQPAH